jgi:hypothetical protein
VREITAIKDASDGGAWVACLLWESVCRTCEPPPSLALPCCVDSNIAYAGAKPKSWPGCLRPIVPPKFRRSFASIVPAVGVEWKSRSHFTGPVVGSRWMNSTPHIVLGSWLGCLSRSRGRPPHWTHELNKQYADDRSASPSDASSRAPASLGNAFCFAARRHLRAKLR